jgi:hypothetical protein
MKNNKKEVVIEKRSFTDNATGEEFEASTIIQDTDDKDWGFDKVWLGHIMTIIQELGNQKMKVIGWLIDNRDRRDNRIVATQPMIAEGANVSTGTVFDTVSALIECKVLKKERNGVYRLNPDLIFYGGHKKRMNIVYQFNDTTEDLQDSQKQKHSENSPSKPPKRKKKATPA